LQAEALVNLGLQNRAMAPTLMNTTSSRSHTILTVKIEQREYAMGACKTRLVRLICTLILSMLDFRDGGRFFRPQPARGFLPNTAEQAAAGGSCWF
jgi:hypothetical protein